MHMCYDLQRVARTWRIKKYGVSPAAATLLELLYETSTSNKQHVEQKKTRALTPMENTGVSSYPQDVTGE